MDTYSVLLIEVRSKVVKIEAPTDEEAKKLARQKVYRYEIVFDKDDMYALDCDIVLE